MEATAFVPGHISAFFEPVFTPQSLDRTGSRGAGLCLTLGATSTVTLNASPEQTIQVHINGIPTIAPVTTLACRHLLGEQPCTLTIQTTLALPISQGFGMSAAGAYSTALALTHLLRRSQIDALQAAHYAEVQLRTGLGDVIAAFQGGIEIRRQPGLPPWGMTEHIPGQAELVLAVVGEPIKTKDILTNPTTLKTITTVGRRCTKQLLDHPSLENLLRLGQRFAQETKLASPEVQTAIDAASAYGLASQSMLGNAVYAIGNTTMLQKTLGAFGKVWVCTIDPAGARLI
jgi:pantoate kinase